MNASNFVALTFSTDATTIQEQAARERFHAAIEQAVTTYHVEGRSSLVGIDLYPCQETCTACTENEAA